MIFPAFTPRHLAYPEARPLIRNGDLLLWRPTNLFAQLIAYYSDGPYSHVGSASWSGDVLESHESLQFLGGQTTNLSSHVHRYPGKIDVYRVPRIYGFIFSQAQRRRSGDPYGWKDLMGSCLRVATRDTLRMPWRKRIAEVSGFDQPDLWERLYRAPLDEPAFCSEAVISDIRRAGVNALPDLSAWEVSPNDVARQAEYLFTLHETHTQALTANIDDAVEELV